MQTWGKLHAVRTTARRDLDGDIPMDADLKPSGVLETVLYARDLVAAEAFYADVLGLEVTAKAAGRQVFLRCGEQMLLIFNPDATEVPPPADAKLPVPPHGARGPGHVCFPRQRR